MMTKPDMLTIGGKHKNINIARKFVDKWGRRNHWHDCCEVELVITGKGTHTVNGVRHEVNSGDFYLLTPADCHYYIPDEYTELYGIMFDDKYISPRIYERILTGKSMGIDHFVNLGDERYKTVENLFLALLCEYDRLDVDGEIALFDDYASRIIDCLMIQLLSETADGSRPSSRLYDTNVGSAILYIHQHYNEHITLADAADAVHLSAGYFSELFKSSTGQNFKSYLIDLRLRNACRLLANTDMSVTDICFECGFESFSNFMRTFKNRYGTSPLKFRMKNKSEKMQ